MKARRVRSGSNGPSGCRSCEITNAQYSLFDPAHDSRFEDRTSWIFSEEYLGWPLDGPRQPVVRVSWQRAMQFCDWLSQKTGLRFTLPTEAQWEYACRAGSATPMWYGGLDADFSQVANLADYTIRNLAYEGWRPKSPDLAPREARFNDGKLVTADVGSYRPNPWGLYDMHGNAAEWTRTNYRPYPYREDDGRNTPTPKTKKSSAAAPGTTGRIAAAPPSGSVTLHGSGSTTSASGSSANPPTHGSRWARTDSGWK